MRFLKLSIIVIAFFAVSQVSYAKEASVETEIRDASTFFDDSLNDMQEEMEIATDEGKKGLLLMFEMDECPFCARMKKTVLNRGKIQDYYKEHFRIITVDVEGDLDFVDFEGNDTTQKEFSLKKFRVRATPVFQFVDLKAQPLKNGRLTGATRDSKEFLMLGEYIVSGDNEKMPFIRYKRKQKKKNES